MAEPGSYVYAVGRGLSDGELAGLRGLRGSDLRLVEHRGLCAVVSTVDLEEFGEDGLRRHLEDLDWLEQVAREHDAVIRSVSAVSGVLAPFRLATICRGDDSVRRRLDSWYDDLVRALDRIEGRSEWSIKAFHTRSEAQTHDAETASGSGTAYLARRRAELEQQQQAAADAEAIADELHRQFAASAVASRRLPPQDKRLSGYAEPMILNGAYLVDDAEADAFRAVVAEIAARYPSVRVTVDGPWPPYSFATLETS